jgi:16S rRNA (cytidine1402-2'-O)-methyltransferase
LRANPPCPPPTSAGTPGTLVLVATPIGNLGDLSPRAARVLADADVVACEDTRHTRKLLTHAGIGGKRLVALHEHNEDSQIPALLAWLSDGDSIALVSDAGTPLISDPGGRLVLAAISAGIAVSTVPGPCAAVGALVVSGLDCERWCFEGFLPRAGKARASRLVSLATEVRTSVLYEAPHRVVATLGALAEACGPERRLAVVRELTKLHEEVWRGTLGEAVARPAWSSEGAPPRGEHVIVLAGAPEPMPDTEEEIESALESAVGDLLATGRPVREAAALAGASLGVPRRRAYEAALRVRGSWGGGRARL